jgi:hypothetical protein
MKLVYFIMFFTFTILFSCSPDNKSKFYGTWSCVEGVFYNGGTWKIYDNNIIIEYHGIVDRVSTLPLNSDIIGRTWGGGVKHESVQIQSSKKGVFDIVGNQFLITLNERKFNFSIVSISKSKITLLDESGNLTILIK